MRGTAAHPGALYHVRFPWGMTGPRWRELAAAALGDIGLSGPQ